MSASEERMKILQLVEEGKISPTEGVSLLQALERAQAGALTARGGLTLPAHGGPRWLRVRVTDLVTGKTRVNVRLPVTVLNAGLKMGAKISPELDASQMDQIIEAIRSGTTGTVVDVMDEEDQQRVEVTLE
jgi:hypothetical protein